MFNLYFAGTDPHADDLLQERHALRLFSQSNERNRIEQWKAVNCADRLFIDSGAFSVAHTGKTVDIDEYINYINSNPNIPVFVELDVIPFPVLNAQTSRQCAEDSWKNYLYMKERVTTDCHLLPLYHFGEPWLALDRILNTRVNGELPEYIGIGGRHGVSKYEQEVYFDRIFTIIQQSNNPNVKVHAFGMTMLDTLEKFPFYSADSTSWLKTAITGSIITETCGTIYTGKQLTGVVLDEITQKGFTVNELITDYTKRMRFNVLTYLKWAETYQYKGKKSFNSSVLF